MKNRHTCPTCGHLRETFNGKDGTSGFVPPVEGKPNEDSKAITAQTFLLNKGHSDLVLTTKPHTPASEWKYASDDMEEYASLKLSEANSENARLQSQLAESNQRGDNLYALLNDACNQLTESTFYNKCKQALSEYESTKPNF